MFVRKTFNIDDEYVLHICSTCWKKYEVYKPKSWTDATYYINAWSDDGENWIATDVCGKVVGNFVEKSIVAVANRLFLLNANRHYVLQPCMGCAGSSDKATDFKNIPFDTIAEFKEKNYES